MLHNEYPLGEIRVGYEIAMRSKLGVNCFSFGYLFGFKRQCLGYITSYATIINTKSRLRYLDEWVFKVTL